MPHKKSKEDRKSVPKWFRDAEKLIEEATRECLIHGEESHTKLKLLLQAKKTFLAAARRLFKS